MPETPRRRRMGWVLPAFLLAVYLLLKLQGWGYARSAKNLERQLDEIRPSLAAIVLTEQLESSRQAYLKLSDQLQKSDLQGTRVLERLSALPASVTLERLEIHSRPNRRILLVGSFFPGPRNPEQLLVWWAQKVKSPTAAVSIRKLAPLSGSDGGWVFEVEVQDA